jgi:hypothetical protein
MPLFGRRRVPEAVAAVQLEPGERRSAWGLTPGGEPVVATDRGLRLPGAPRLRLARRREGTWARPGAHRRPRRADRRHGGAPHVQLEDEGRLPDAVRSAVTGSVGWVQPLPPAPAAGCASSAAAARSDLLDWRCVRRPDTDLDDPLVRAQADELLLSARRTVG